MSKIEVNTVDAQCGSTVTIGSAGKTVSVPGNIVKTNALQASDGGNIVNQCGTTVTLGASGDTIALASGASQTGFGRTGTVDWDTSIKTGTVTAVSGSGYFVDTTSGAITVNLPAAAVGSIVAVSDYASTAASNNIIISPNGSEKINAVNDIYTITTAGLAVTLVYADATRGWKSVTGSDADAVGVVPAYIVATGGTPCSGAIVCTNYKVHTFTGPGTFCVSAGAGSLAKADYMVVAGGGGAGGSTNPGGGAGGGGAGGFRESKVAATSGCWTASPLAAAVSLPVSVSPYAVTVGGGGPQKGPGAYVNGFGSNSIFSTITSVGGGDGGMYNGAGSPSGRTATIMSDGNPSTSTTNGGQGGSGGGGGWSTRLGGMGNQPPTSPAQGSSGGTGACAPNYAGGGGGGAGAVGANAGPTAGGNGGAGVTTNITASPVAYAGGGGGASNNSTDGSGGTGGGGAGTSPGGTGGVGSANTGGGGGAGGAPTNATGGAGGSGVVVIRYKFQ